MGARRYASTTTLSHTLSQDLILVCQDIKHTSMSNDVQERRLNRRQKMHEYSYIVYWCVCERECVCLCVLRVDTCEKRIGSEAD
jgi:hypothetical protein